MFTPSLAAEDLDHVLAHTEDLWNEVRGERVFITGGGGFFGTWLVESFLWANERLDLHSQVMVLTRDSKAFARRRPNLLASGDLKIWVGEIDEFDIPPGRFASVIHTATARYSQDGSFDRLAAYHKDVRGTDRVLELATHAGARNFLFTSSGAAYGPQPTSITHVPEEYLGAPSTEDTTAGYGHAKRASEVLAAMAAARNGFKASIARAFTFVGPYLALDANFAVGNFLRSAMLGETVVIQGDGSPHRSHLYAADLAIWLWTILFRGAAGRIYNVGSDRSMSIAELAHRVVSAVRPSTEIRICRAPDPLVPPKRYVPSIRRAAEELHLKQYIDLENALDRTARWYRHRSALA